MSGGCCKPAGPELCPGGIDFVL